MSFATFVMKPKIMKIQIKDEFPISRLFFITIRTIHDGKYFDVSKTV